MWILQNKENFSSPVKEIIGANNFQAKLRSSQLVGSLNSFRLFEVDYNEKVNMFNVSKYW